jgi:hypothetical protein
MISLQEDFAEPDDEARAECSSESPGIPCPAEDVKMWEEVFSLLLPPPLESDGKVG